MTRISENIPRVERPFNDGDAGYEKRNPGQIPPGVSEVLDISSLGSEVVVESPELASLRLELAGLQQQLSNGDPKDPKILAAMEYIQHQIASAESE